MYKNEADVTLTEKLEVELRGPKSTLGVDGISSENKQIIIYPNPAEDIITLKVNSPIIPLLNLQNFWKKRIKLSNKFYR